jgi:c-di-GMP-binding flagellar brake protein YcgR
VKIIDIEANNKLIFRFKYKEKPYSMIVDIIAKTSKYIIIPAILQGNQVVDPGLIMDAELVYTVKDGVFQFTNLKIDVSMIMEMRAYLVSTEEDISRLNRREAYRVFIGEILKITTISKGGRKRTYEGILKDVSVLGMGVILKSDIEIGSMISILYTYEGLNVYLLGEIIRKEKIGRYRAFTYGCKFKDPNNTINRIVILKQIRSKNEKSE